MYAHTYACTHTSCTYRKEKEGDKERHREKEEEKHTVTGRGSERKRRRGSREGRRERGTQRVGGERWERGVRKEKEMMNYLGFGEIKRDREERPSSHTGSIVPPADSGSTRQSQLNRLSYVCLPPGLCEIREIIPPL